jgi:thiol-disulfide isomerase/thioredoxin
MMVRFDTKRLVIAILVMAAIAPTTQFAVAQESVKSLVLHDGPRPAPAVQFTDEEGRPRTLADFKGKVVVLNLWATWCVPCRKEMPALDQLQGTLGGAGIEVVPVSIDRGGVETVRKFYSEINIRSLAIYTDTSGQALRAAGTVGLPTTLIINRAGQEIGRALGPAEWDAPEIADMLQPVIADTSRDVVRSPGHASPNAQEQPGLLRRAVQWLAALFRR